VPFYNVLWAEASNGTLVIDYATVSKSHRVELHNLTYSLEDASTIVPTTWVDELLSRAYDTAQRRKRAKVLVNPHSGPGGAEKIWENDVKPLFDAARMQLDIVRTKFSGEAIEICEKLDIDAYDIVIPCSGDGLPYECFNGLGKRPDARRALQQLAIAHIPCGSGNALSCNVNGNHRAGPAALAIVKGVRTAMDLMSITQGDRRILSFLSQSFGIVAECDLGTEDMRWMGAARFNVGLIQRIFKKRTWPCEVSVKVAMSDKQEIKAHYKREMAAADHNVRREGDAVKALTNGHSGPNGAESGDGLPPLKYGTVNDEVPSDWETSTHDEMGNFYCGNVSVPLTSTCK
jgi:sphingosine kinase